MRTFPTICGRYIQVGKRGMHPCATFFQRLNPASRHGVPSQVSWDEEGNLQDSAQITSDLNAKASQFEDDICVEWDLLPAWQNMEIVGKERQGREDPSTKLRMSCSLAGISKGKVELTDIQNKFCWNIKDALVHRWGMLMVVSTKPAGVAVINSNAS